jgi:uncharacterized membrane protein (GlpM family)
LDAKLLALYFFLGGVVVSLVTVFGSSGKGILAAFVACFPAVTVITLSAIYVKAGMTGAIAYSRGIVLMAPAWFLYIGIVLFLLPRVGFVPALAIGVVLYVASSLIIMRLFH